MRNYTFLKYIILFSLTIFTLQPSSARKVEKKADQLLKELKDKYSIQTRGEDYHQDLLKLSKKYPHYIPLHMAVIESLHQINRGDFAELLYKNRWQKKKSKENQILHLYSQMASWRIAPNIIKETLSKIEKVSRSAKGKEIQADFNYMANLIILKRSRNNDQKKKAVAFFLENAPLDHDFLSYYSRYLADIGNLDKLISLCEKEMSDKVKVLHSCHNISRAQTEKSKEQEHKINNLVERSKTYALTAKEEELDFLIELYHFNARNDKDEVAHIIGNKIATFNKDWVPSESLRENLNIQNFKEYIQFDNLYKIVSMPDVSQRIKSLNEYLDQIDDHKELSAYLYQSLLSSYLHPTIKNNDKAIETLEDWLDIEKDSDYAKRRLAELYLQEKKELEKALELINDAITFHYDSFSKRLKYYPDFSEYLKNYTSSLTTIYRTKGEIYMAMDKYDMAISPLKMAFQLEPNPLSAYKLHHSYLQLEQKRKSFEWGLISLVKTDDKIEEDLQKKVTAELRKYLSSLSPQSMENLNLEELIESKKALYSLSDQDDKKEDKKKHPLIGKKIIPLPYKDLTKKMFDWKTLKGKNVLISFWATWCVPCIQELTVLEKLKKEYKGKPFEVVAICTDGVNRKKDMYKILKKAKVKNLNILMGKSDSMDTYGFSSIPTSFYVNPKGEIIDKGQGYSENLEQEIKEKLHL